VTTVNFEELLLCLALITLPYDLQARNTVVCNTTIYNLSVDSMLRISPIQVD